MMGFVSAISAALCIMVVISCLFMTNLLKIQQVALEKKRSMFSQSATFAQGDSQSGLNDGVNDGVHDGLISDLLVSDDALQALKSISGEDYDVVLQCNTADFSEKSIERFVVINYLYLKKEYPDINVIIAPITHDPNASSSCSLKLETKKNKN